MKIKFLSKRGRGIRLVLMKKDSCSVNSNMV